MEMKGEERLPVPRGRVWAALNDPDVLRRSIPGCKALEKESDTAFSATVDVKVGPIRATFGSKVTLCEVVAPSGYRIAGEGKGGIAGFARGGASISLEEDGPERTVLRYDVDAQVGGKLAQLGSRLIESTAKKLFARFFEQLVEIVSQSGPDASGGQPDPAKALAREEKAPPGEGGAEGRRAVAEPRKPECGERRR